MLSTDRCLVHIAPYLRTAQPETRAMISAASTRQNERPVLGSFNGSNRVVAAGSDRPVPIRAVFSTSTTHPASASIEDHRRDRSTRRDIEDPHASGPARACAAARTSSRCSSCTQPNPKAQQRFCGRTNGLARPAACAPRSTCVEAMQHGGDVESKCH